MNNKKITVVKKMALPFLLSQQLFAGVALANASSSEKVEYKKCQESKNRWLFSDFMDQSKFQFKKKALEKLSSELKGVDLLRISDSEMKNFYNQGRTMKVPDEILLSLYCIEKFSKLHPEDLHKDYNCGLSCGVTVR